MSKYCFTILLFGIIGTLLSPAVAQETTLPPPAPPLPPFNIKAQEKKFHLANTENGLETPSQVEFTGDVRLLWGDVSLRADHLIYSGDTGQVIADGNIVLVRGDETIHGSKITFFLQTGTFTVDNGRIISPPLSLSGTRIERVNGVVRAYQSVVTPDPEGKGELKLLAREVRIVPGQFTEFSDVRIYLYGQRVLTLPHYLIKQQYGPRKADIPQIPLRIKYTRISGFALGLGNSWTLARNATAITNVFFPTKNGPQVLLSANYDLMGTDSNAPPFLRRRQRDSLLNALSENSTTDTTPPTPSPLRRLLTVQPSPGKDAVLDFEPLLGTTESIGDPLQESPRSAVVTATFSSKEEFGVKRQGNLLIERQPEVRFVTAFPLNAINPNGGKDFETNAAARHYLRSPRLSLLADLTTGKYSENRLSNDTSTQGTIETVNATRTGGEVGLNMLPLLVGNNLLIRSHVSFQEFRYGGGDSYQVPEVGVAASWILDRRTQIGGAVYQRAPSGHTPFFFDQIDTRSEAQGLMQGRLTSHITAALLLRYDLEQARLFDYGVTVGVRGRSLEPRFGYRKLGGQFSLGFALVGF